MASAFELWLTPTITLSLVLESESDVPSLSRFVSQWLLYLRPALLRQALAYELQQRPDLDVVSAGTLRVVDYAYWRATRAQVSRSLCSGLCARSGGPRSRGSRRDEHSGALAPCGAIRRRSGALNMATDLRRPTLPPHHTQQKRELYQPVPSGSLAYDIALLEGVEVPSVVRSVSVLPQVSSVG